MTDPLGLPNPKLEWAVCLPNIQKNYLKFYFLPWQVLMVFTSWHKMYVFISFCSFLTWKLYSCFWTSVLTWRKQLRHQCVKCSVAWRLRIWCVPFCFSRRKLHQANENLRKVLIEMVRSTIATEELIGQKISAKAKTSEQMTHQRSSTGNKDAQESGQLVSDSFWSCSACYALVAQQTVVLLARSSSQVFVTDSVYTDELDCSIQFFWDSMYNLNICNNPFRLRSFCRYFSCRLVFRCHGADPSALWEPAGFRYSDQSWGRRSSTECLQQTETRCWHTTGAAQPGQHSGKGRKDVLISQQATQTALFVL